MYLKTRKSPFKMRPRKTMKKGGEVSLSKQMASQNPSSNGTDYKSYTSAGVLFTNGIHVLAGYQPNKKNGPVIMGIGGTRDATDTSYLHTALREAVEELLDIDPEIKEQISESLLKELNDNLPPLSHFIHKGYVTLIYSFEQLERLLKIVNESKHSDVLKTKISKKELYEKFPLTLEELVFRRKRVESAEIRQFVILPLECSQIYKYFLTDLKMALEHLNLEKVKKEKSNRLSMRRTVISKIGKYSF